MDMDLSAGEGGTETGRQGRVIDLTPTWGEVGQFFWRLAVSGEQKAMHGMRTEVAKAFAGMEVLNQLLATLTPEQHAIFERVMAVETAKQR